MQLPFTHKAAAPSLADVVRELHEDLGRGAPSGIDERRASARKPCVGPVIILPLGEGDTPKLRDRRDGVAVDISEGGMRVLARVKINDDRVVQLTVLSARGGKHEVRCEVVRRRRLPSGYWEFGMRFLSAA